MQARTRLVSVKALGITAAVLLSMPLLRGAPAVRTPATAAPETAVLQNLQLADFETAAPSVRLIGEGIQPESRVARTTKKAYSGRWAAELDYTFRPGIKSPRQYVELFLDASLVGRVRAISARVYGDGSGEMLKLRVRDGTGETFQYRYGPIDWTGWKRVVFPLDRHLEVRWGGNRDGRLDPPIHGVSFLVDSPVKPHRGRLYFDAVRYTTLAAPAALFAVRFRTPVPGNAFYGRAPELILVLQNLDREHPRIVRGRVEIVDGSGRRAAEVPRRFSLAPGAVSRTLLRPRLPGYGLYHARFAADPGADSNIRAETAFSYLPFPAAPKADPSSIFGVSMHFGHGGRGPLEFNLRLASDMGIRRLRDDAGWGGIEHEPGVYHVPAVFDRFLRTARPRWGCDPLIILDYSNSLYEKDSSVRTAAGRRAYAAWAEYMARTYRQTVRYWEVWNEPNIGFWKPRPNPVEYAKLLKAAYPAVKRGNPKAVVVGMCTAGIDYRFIEKVLQQGTTGFFDAVSVHPYRYPRAPESAPSLVGDLRKLMALLDRYGAGRVPILLTEIGWPNQEDRRGLPESVSADYLARLYLLVSQFPRIHGVYWYDFQNDGTTRTYNEHNFGLLHHDFTPKAPAVAMRMTSMALHGKRFRGKLADGPNLYAFDYTDARGRHTVAAWSTAKGATLTLRWPGAKVLRAVSAAGPERSVSLRGGVLALPVTGTPVFLSGPGTPRRLPPLLGAAVEGPAFPGHFLRLAVTVHNPWPRRLAARCRVAPPPGWPAPPPGPLRHWPCGKTVRRLRLQVPLEAEPGSCVPLEVRLAGAGGAILARVRTPVTVRSPARLRLEPVRTPQGPGIRIRVRAALAPPPRITGLRLDCPAAWGGAVRIPAPPAWARKNGEFQAECIVPVRRAPRPPAIGNVSARLRLADGNTAAATRTMDFWNVPYHTPAPLDAPAAWKAIPRVPVTRFDGPHKGDWHGPKDASAHLAVAWDAKRFYLYADVVDDVQAQPWKNGDIWKGDSLQFGLDPQPNSRPGSAPWSEIGAALTSGGPVVFRWTAPRGPVPGAECRIRRSGGHTLYFLAVPWADLGMPSAPAPGTPLGFAAVLNDNDGHGRKGWLALFDGIGWSKHPEKFGILFPAGR